uniref:hypothetical protein n=1 Tax=uncultured Draconibacterium sp. TaxID=1573823 RepID=UPI00321785FF
MNEKLDGPPISGEYEEILFDLPEPWRGQVWHYVKFITKNGLEWVGGFREKDSHNFLVAEIENKGIVCVVSGGHGYIIDIERKKKIKDIETDTILDLAVDQETESFYISRWWDLKLVDNEFNEIDIQVPIDCDGIFFKEMDGRELNLKIEEIGAGLTKNRNYYVDLDERKIKKRSTTMLKSNGRESSKLEVKTIKRHKSWLKGLWS